MENEECALKNEKWKLIEYQQEKTTCSLDYTEKKSIVTRITFRWKNWENFKIVAKITQQIVTSIIKI